jgi:hypothetical protein
VSARISAGHFYALFACQPCWTARSFKPALYHKTACTLVWLLALKAAVESPRPGAAKSAGASNDMIPNLQNPLPYDPMKVSRTIGVGGG